MSGFGDYVLLDDAFRDAEWYNREAVPSRITRAALAP